MILFTSNLSVQTCLDKPTYTFVFGDNLIGRGMAGQANIRNCPNSFGVPTKRLPSMRGDAFFSDKQSEYDIVLAKLVELWNIHLSGGTIVLPQNMIGSGLAKLQYNSPTIWNLIVRFYTRAKQIK